MPGPSSYPRLFIGLMSGTSLDGVDGVLAAFASDHTQAYIETLATAYVPLPPALQSDFMALQSSGDNEIHREALAAAGLIRCYADCVESLLVQANIPSDKVIAVGAHGQTIRHRPELGYTRQMNNPALLAELTGIDVVADFRSRDIAAGGQGAPLVPAFHQAVFANTEEARVVANIGGISNISVLSEKGSASVIGFDTGPGNILLDGWTARHLNKRYDAEGAWAASGKVVPDLLKLLGSEPFFMLPPPKSTGRDLFHLEWLDQRLASFQNLAPADVQATLAALTADTLADAISRHAASADAVYVCGGGAYNNYLMKQIQQALIDRNHSAIVSTTEALNIAPNNVEALAFAWLAHRFTERQPGNLPSVTGAKGLRILGSLYPA